MSFDIEKCKADGQRMALRTALLSFLRRMRDLPAQEDMEFATHEQFDTMLANLDAARHDAIEVFNELKRLDPDLPPL